MHLGKSVRAAKPRKFTLQQLSAEVNRLRKRVEDLEDLRDLNGVITHNKGSPAHLGNRSRKNSSYDG